MANPVLVEALRGGVVESRHRGAVAVVDADGGQVVAIGDVERPVFPRSAVKAIQALPLVESGTADAYHFGNREIALASASHAGEWAHVELVQAMLARAGLDEPALECGAHWPTNHETTVALARSGAVPTQLHNNCSGKHAGFLCTCVHNGIDHHGYIGHGHAFQEMVREALETVTGAAHSVDACGTDGCSIPTYAVPLKNLAHGFARMASGTGLSSARAAAARRIFAACTAEPFYVAGTGRADTVMMEAGGGRLFTKGGAEGVFCAAILELGLGIALKCDDGAGRAAEVMVAAVLRDLLPEDDPLRTALAAMAQPALKNWRGIEVGSLRPAGALAG
ncbi:asparaginase [Chelativorans salis]|uniref:Asparaginase n=1 Tax=Chelativorans salis TaxID=2978478 RepID=A0ABT2LGI1_9HYPH|nr:asparaginase [Chelativorans sp. EGI FJ00035]MCT7373478.1 asparaginase [Chelativorans sp. EGI FJ00035]